MIRCIEIQRDSDELDRRRWAFLDTARNKFVEIADEHVFTCISQLREAVEAHNSGAGDRRLDGDLLLRLATSVGMPESQVEADE